MIRKSFRMFVENKNFCCEDCCKTLNKPIYTRDFLIKFCKDNNIILYNDLEEEKINGFTMIDAKCIDCDNPMIRKSFRMFVENKNFCCNDCCETRNKEKYTYDYLMNVCKENNIILLQEYRVEDINRHTIINAQCIYCDKKMVPKSFRQLMDSQNYGCKYHNYLISQEKFK